MLQVCFVISINLLELEILHQERKAAIFSNCIHVQLHVRYNNLLFVLVLSASPSAGTNNHPDPISLKPATPRVISFWSWQLNEYLNECRAGPRGKLAGLKLHVCSGRRGLSLIRRDVRLQDKTWRPCDFWRCLLSLSLDAVFHTPPLISKGMLLSPSSHRLDK